MGTYRKTMQSPWNDSADTSYSSIGNCQIGPRMLKMSKIGLRITLVYITRIDRGDRLDDLGFCFPVSQLYELMGGERVGSSM